MQSSIEEWMESRSALVVSGLFLAVAGAGMLLGGDAWEAWAWGSVIISGLPIAREALEQLIVRRRISSALLITVAMAAAIAIGELFAAGECAFIMALGEAAEHGSVARAKRGLRRLMELAPAQARLLTPEGERLVAAREVRVGDRLRILPGERIPADGTVLSGCSDVDCSLLTGEPLPKPCGEGDTLFAGALNLAGCVELRATREGSDTALQRLIRLVREAGEKPAPIQREADRWAQYLVPISMGLALCGYGVLRLAGIEDALLRAVTVLIVFCPCALVLATPTAMMAAIGQAARKGVIIKSGEALECLARTDTLAFDKTGTLTHGRPELAALHPSPASSAQELLTLAAALEAHSEHPLARAVVRACGSAVPLPAVSGFRSHTGRGVSGSIGGQRYLCGREEWVCTHGGLRLDTAAAEQLRALRGQGMSTMLLARESTLLGIIGLSDTLRSEAPDVLRELSERRLLLLTGDKRQAAEHLADGLPADLELHADLLPEDKCALIARRQSEGHLIAMVGDGINDTPALKQADVGIAVSRPDTELATETADVALMHNELSLLPYLLRLSRATLRTIRLGIAASLLLNFIAIALSLAGLLGPVSGALVHNAGSLLVILNAARLYERKC
ncbi:MAG: heavy metal translocating P-type ATPase [Akkermansia sp.]